MVFFKVLGSVNVKIADNSLIAFKNFDDKLPLVENEIYCTSYDDSQNTAKVLKKAGNKYKLEYIDVKTINQTFSLPSQLGIGNFNELNKMNNNLNPLSPFVFSDQCLDIVQKYLPSSKPQVKITSFLIQGKHLKKKKISLAIIDPFREKIGEILAGVRAIELLHSHLLESYSEIQIDIYIQSIDRIHYLRDFEILKQVKIISNIKPLPLKIQELQKYDFFIDHSSLEKNIFLATLPKIDAFLLKFGLDYTKIDNTQKYLSYEFPKFTIAIELLEKLEQAKLKGKLLLFHPYSPDIDRSIPKDVTMRLFKELVLLAHDHDFVVVSSLKIDNFDDDCYVDLSKFSKTFFDFAYIISQMDYMISIDTATVYLADLFFIPSVVIVNDKSKAAHIKYHLYQKAFILDQLDSHNLSHFDTLDDRLMMNKYPAWKQLHASALVKSLDALIQECP